MNYNQFFFFFFLFFENKHIELESLIGNPKVFIVNETNYKCPKEKVNATQNKNINKIKGTKSINIPSCGIYSEIPCEGKMGPNISRLHLGSRREKRN